MVPLRAPLAERDTAALKREAPSFPPHRPPAFAGGSQPIRQFRRLALIGLLLLVGGRVPRIGANDADIVLHDWLAAQTNLQTWSAEFVQTRFLKVLVQPLVSTGRVWFARPNRFRWELGQPVQTLAARDEDRLLLIYPRLRRVERIELRTTHQGPLGEALNLLDAGFPKDRADFDSRFRLRALVRTNDAWRLDLQPASPAARRWMPLIALTLNATNFDLVANELSFTDGSRLRNDFRATVHNEVFPPETFRPAIDPGFQMVDLRTGE